MLTHSEKIRRRTNRIRYTLKKRNNGLPRLSVFLSNQNIYAQVIDDLKGITLASASTVDKELRSKDNKGPNRDIATRVGELVANRAKKAGIKKVVFDRGCKVYHGKVKALADGARNNGLEF